MKNITIITFIILFILTGINFYKVFNPCQIKYVDIGKLLDEYHFKKDLEKKTNSDLLRIKNVIDSLRMLKNTQNNIQIDSNINRLEILFSNYYTKSNEEISKKVWDRLNPAIKNFGEKNKINIIIGANGTGTILYGNNEQEVTGELIKYVNTIYETGM